MPTLAGFLFGFIFGGLVVVSLGIALIDEAVRKALARISSEPLDFTHDGW